MDGHQRPGGIDIDDGEFIVLVGPSGCGKSTLMRMIVGLEDIAEGDLLIDGQRVNADELKPQIVVTWTRPAGSGPDAMQSCGSIPASCTSSIRKPATALPGIPRPVRRLTQEAIHEREDEIEAARSEGVASEQQAN